MNKSDEKIKTGINIIKGCLVLSLPSEVSSEIIEAVKHDVMKSIKAQKIIGVVLDFCSVNVIDSYEFSEIMNICEMSDLLGSKAVLAGLQPGVVTSILDMDVDTDNLTTFLNLEDGLDHFLDEYYINDSEENQDDSTNEDSDDLANEDSDDKSNRGLM